MGGINMCFTNLGFAMYPVNGNRFTIAKFYYIYKIN